MLKVCLDTQRQDCGFWWRNGCSAFPPKLLLVFEQPLRDLLVVTKTVTERMDCILTELKVTLLRGIMLSGGVGWHISLKIMKVLTLSHSWHTPLIQL